ncbi:RecQ family ATP-dependent DNA helicase [Microbulbifer halophilus]|uniref:ATP-dependent DNA helicase RecQ n=1 Tax=Microbulbifer halophilus TaxID=453963 RepID=A0ABW5ECE8_9GAMM|nr:ATP-dependent DNA helicase RecQ [Microbulbifer halophilus]MCW8128126.1 RecQ family ATP-dependent DNA helicase [Microbulbifer halophilus]
MANDPQQILQKHFRLQNFKPGQRAVIDTLLAGESALAIFPTGGGKSLCYQLPALAIDGLTLVISPLIALMQDQVDTLQSLGIAAARLDSSRSGDEVREIYRQLRGGELKLLYIAPERLQNERFLQLLRGLRIGLMAVDEAHCISEWGHNFRPDYLKLAGLAGELGVERILALTATATPEVAADIRRQFGIADGAQVQTGFYRENLQLAVTPCGESHRLPRLTERLQSAPQDPAIVYVTLQQTAESVAGRLSEAGVRAAAYHAGMKPEERERIQNAFMAGEVNAVVATIAFGMGIDKADIRAVYHYNLPKSLENYMQEIGRAGRDGEPARCELFACAGDVRVLENFTYGDTPIAEHLWALLRRLLEQGEEFDISVYELSNQFDIRQLVVNTALTYLELEGVIRATGPFYTTHQIRFLQPAEQILQRFDPARADFLQRLFDAGKMGRTWLTIEVQRAGEQLGEPRTRILKALQFLEEQGCIETRAKGVRQGYRRLQLPDLPALGERLEQLFARREQQDLARLQLVLDYAASPECLPAQLCGYFGERLSQPCGHCSSCREPRVRELPGAAPEAIGEEQRREIGRLVAEQREALSHPRQLARFLCGLASPATVRLRKHPQFGSLSRQPFREVLALAERYL